MDSRIPIEVGQHADNLDYLRSKVEKMAHWISFREKAPTHEAHAFLTPLIDSLKLAASGAAGQPYVTLHYTQSLNGRIVPPFTAAAESMQAADLLRYLGQHHDAILTDLASLKTGGLPGPESAAGLAEYPELVLLDEDQVALANWEHPPHFPKPPILLSTTEYGPRHSLPDWLSEARIVTLASSATANRADQIAILCRELGFKTLLVMGAAPLIGAFQNSQSVNYCVITINPYLACSPASHQVFSPEDVSCTGLSLRDCHYHTLDRSTVVCGTAGQP